MQNSIESTLRKCWKKGWFSVFFIVPVFVYLLYFTWLKWGDIIVDVGREMYVPMEISQGRLLYRDINYIYGPFSPYFNAALFKVFGVHLYSLILSGIITTIATSLLIYKISRFFLNLFFSTFIVLTFLIVFAFGQYLYLGNYNFILPYTYAAIHGVAFSLAALYCFCLAIFRSSVKYKYFASFFIALTLLTRIEMGIMLIFITGIGAIFYRMRLKDKASVRILLPEIFIYIIAPIFTAGFIYLLFFTSIREGILRSGLFDMLFSNMNTQRVFTKWLSGLSEFPGNLTVIFKSLFNYVFLIILFALGGIAIGRLYKVKDKILKAASLLITYSFFILAGLFFVIKYFPFDWQYRPLPLFCLAVVLQCIFRLLYQKNLEKRQENLILLALSMLAFMLMVRTIFFVRAAHYGFYILIPGIILYHIFFLKLLPEALTKKLNKGFFKAGFIFVFIAFLIGHFNVSRWCYKNKALKISSPRGTMYTFANDRENKCRQLVEYLLQNTDKKETLAVFPEGVTINFLSERQNPLYFYIYLPLDLEKKEAVEELIQEIESRRVDYIVINQRRTDEYGYPVFGRDYARPVWDYIIKNYALLKQFGPFPFATEEEYGIVLLKRKI